MFLMAVLWTICGAGRGVGKTHLALGLAAVLPNAVSAKLGCGRAKPGKPGNFFRKESELAQFVDGRRDSCEHIVVECNAWARKGKGDIIVFLDSTLGRANVRGDADELRSNSHIQVRPGASLRHWKRVLHNKLNDSAVREGVYNLLAEQKRFVSKPGLSVRSKVWFVADDQHAFGSGLTDLLERIDHLGTLTEAARSSNISYRRAWDLIKDAEKHLGKKLIIPHSGGLGGGGSLLSPEGRRLLDVFKRVNREVAGYADQRFAAYSREEVTDGQV